MHELGIVIEIAKTVEQFANNNNLTKVDTLVLQIGRLAPVVPKYIEQCYPAAVDGTMLEDTKLEIHILPANAICKKCGKVFDLLKEEKICPSCGGTDWDVLSGTEFMIKEIIAY